MVVYVSILTWICFLVSLIGRCYPRPTTVIPVSSSTSGRPYSFHLEWLTSYGYLPKISKDLLSEEEHSMALSKAQEFGGISPTGQLDEETMRLMELPRCGVPDIRNRSNVEMFPTSDPGFQVTRRAGNRIEYFEVWAKTTITYRYMNFSPDLKRSEIRDAVETAFQYWSDVTPLTFRQVFDGRTPDIEIWFATGDHGDGSVFDGKGGILAHAFYPGPGIGGDMHFDDDEYFTVGSYFGTNLFFTALHELGHSLGLDHSSNSAAVMAPFYRGYNPNIQLHEDDIRAIQRLYGPKPPQPTTMQTTAPPPTTAFVPIVCSVKDFDAIVYKEGDLYLFKDQERWKVSKNKTVVTTSDFSQGPSRVDAGFTRSDGTVVLINATHYWEYEPSSKLLKDNFPVSLRSLNLPDHIDASLYVQRTNQTLFFQSDKFWVEEDFSGVNTTLDVFSASDKFHGILYPLHAAFSVSNGSIYFVRGNQYSRFSLHLGSIEENYPRDFHVDWLGCPEEKKKPNKTSTLEISAILYSIFLLLSLLLPLL
ncbi:Matrix metalloproteinase-16 [Holothuria leucospilota]|uniref:Matrix metalloproteinase-16 n=1 Tax=Holothuria leucospilota TaxID=206669 RepID=A0A9Q1CDW3_HOLLE|nr:Matrix metalloproteinase-16 [Holothuria leucospilota]